MTDVVVITGATKGVGRAVAERFARDGARIALLARGRDGLDGTVKAVERLGGQALPLPTDVADPDAVDAAASATEEAFGPIDIWINDAMTTVFGFFWDVAPGRVPARHRGHVPGRRLGDALARSTGCGPRDRGTIVQVGSALAYRGIPLQAPYCGAKHAMQGVLRVRADGAHARRLERPRDDGAAARPEHAPVRPLPLEDAEEADARPADLPAGGRGGGDPPRRLREAARGLVSAARPCYTILGERARALARRPLPREDGGERRSRRASRSTRRARGTCSSRSTRAIPARTATSTRRRTPGRLQATATRHRGKVLAGAAALALLIAGVTKAA